MAGWQDARTIVERLTRALDEFDWPAAGVICCELGTRLNRCTEPFPADMVKPLLYPLRRKRRFDLLERLAEQIYRSGTPTSTVTRLYAQAMVDRGNLSGGEMFLRQVLADPEASAFERAEARGLLGRIYKQLYVDAADPANARQRRNLQQAIHHYHEAYLEDAANTWHGVNVAALLARARGDGVPVSESIDETIVARTVLAQIEARRERDVTSPWDYATASEACLALGDVDGARENTVAFVSYGAASVDAFEVFSFQRQLREVWRIQVESEPGASMLPLLDAALLARHGGELDLLARNVCSGLESVFGKDRYQPFAWLQTALQRCQAVARIEDTMGNRFGSGFLVDAADFFDQPVQGAVLLTNAHVVTPCGNFLSTAVYPDRAVAVFEALGEKRPIKQLLWHSAFDQLDATFVSIDPLPAYCSPCPLQPPPDPFRNDLSQRLYVIGYPKGGGLSISLQDSVWLAADQRFLHYRTPTEKGNSGSPVFDQAYWTVVGLHHRGLDEMPRLDGKGVYAANEAVSIQAIQAETRKTGLRAAGASG